MWRGGGRSGMSVAAPFVWRCPSSLAIAPFPHPAHRTGHADFPHPALGQDLTPSPTTGRCPSCGQAYEPEVPVEVREWIAPAPASPDLVLVAQPPAQPRCGVAVERSIRSAGGPYLEVVRPAAQRAVQLAHHLRGLLPYPSSGRSAHGPFRPCAGCSSSTAACPDGLCRSSANTSARTCNPGSRTALPGPCRFVSSPR